MIYYVRLHRLFFFFFFFFKKKKGHQQKAACSEVAVMALHGRKHETLIELPQETNLTHSL